MGLQDLKLKKVLKEAFKKLLKRGVPPSFIEVSKEVSDIPLSSPTTQPLQFPFHSKFDIEKYNEFLKACQSDFEVLYEGLYLQLYHNLSLLEKRNTELSRAIREAKIVDDLFENEIHLSQYSSGYFYSFFDTFRTVDNIDLQKSDISVDLGTESVRLQRSNANTKRINLLQIDQDQIAVSVAAKSLVKTETVPGQELKNIFDSLDTSWQHEVLTETKEKVTLSVIFPLSKNLDEREVSSVVIEGYYPKEATIEVSKSRDGNNFSLIGTKSVIPGAAIRFQTQPTPIKYIKFSITKRTPDEIISEVGNIRNVYRFITKEVSVYKEAFNDEGTLYTKLLTPSNSSLVINKVSLVVDDEIPEGTTIDYSIAPDTDPTTWFPISPINRTESSYQRVVDFRQLVTVPPFSNIVDISSASISTYTFPDGSTSKNGLTFFTVHTLNDSPQFDSVKFYRGINGWRRTKKEGPVRIKEERNNYVIFSNKDSSQQFYVNVFNEELSAISDFDGTTQTKIYPKFPLLVEPSFRVSAVSSPNQNSPDYIVGRLIQRPASNTSRTTSLSFSNNASGSTPGVTIRIGSSSEGLEGKKIAVFTGILSIPVRRLTNQTVNLKYTTVYGNNVEDNFTIEQVLVKNNTSVMVLLDPHNKIQDADNTKSIFLSIESLDITGDIADTDENTVYLDPSLEVRKGDSFIIDYRRQLINSEEIIDSSIEVRDTIDGNKVYVFGKDYTVDFVNKTISVTSDGDIKVGDVAVSIRLSFQYKSRTPDLYTYETNVVVPFGGVNAIIQPLSLNEKESAVLIGETGAVDLSSTSILKLAPGTYTVRVVTKIPRILSNNTIDTNNALYKTINIKDSKNNYLFQQGLYFERMQAWLSPMKEVSMFELTSNTYKEDHSKFSVDDKKIVFNFNPLDEDSFYLVPGSSIVARKETFAIGYTYKPSLPKNVSGVYFRAYMRKSPKTQLSPELHSYTLRFSHGV